MLDGERTALARAARRLVAEKLVPATAGNLSLRVGDRLVVTPTGTSLADLTLEDIPVLDLGGHRLHGERAPTSELDLHLAIHRRHRPAAVVHSHPEVGTALACVLDEVPVIHYAMVAFGGSVRVAPYATFASTELVAAVLAALEDRTAALMAGPAVVFADSLDGAVANSVLLEWVCAVYWRASLLGPPRTLDAVALDAVRKAVARLGYGPLRPAAPVESGLLDR